MRFITVQTHHLGEYCLELFPSINYGEFKIWNFFQASNNMQIQVYGLNIWVNFPLLSRRWIHDVQPFQKVDEGGSFWWALGYIVTVDIPSCKLT